MTPNEKFQLTRKRAGLSQGRVAKRAGTDQNAVSQYELGYRKLNPALVARLEDALRAELADMAQEARHLLQYIS
jgi:transcriptional regulator with XRE-family HTH domain